MRAASADSAPHRASGARGVANSVRGKPSEAIRSSSQSPSGPASAVAQASDGSLAMSPPNAARSQSFGCSAQRAARSVSGSCAASHASSGPAMPGDTGFGDAGHRATSAVARASGHSSAGRSALPDAPVSTTPCICPEKPIARTRARSCSGSRGGVDERAPPRGDVDLRPAGLRRRDRVRGARRRAHAAVAVDDRELEGAGPQIDAEKSHNETWIRMSRRR
ncbi:hypothetical protein DM77_3766 [Burkholderia mallei]|nr:hypothetical protein DM77_3766 [Burkholderia mallei]